MPAGDTVEIAKQQVGPHGNQFTKPSRDKGPPESLEKGFYGIRYFEMSLRAWLPFFHILVPHITAPSLEVINSCWWQVGGKWVWVMGIRGRQKWGGGWGLGVGRSGVGDGD